MSELAPSILSADFNRLGEQLKKIEENGIRILHIDVMDGWFVPSISFGMPVISSIRRECSMKFDVHMMVQEPIRYVEDMVKAGADSITVHYEACEDLKKTIAKIHRLGVKCAVAINPATPVSAIEDILDELDMVLVMAVNPGFGGQTLIPETLDKVLELIRIRRHRGLQYKIEIDGGVTRENFPELVRDGIDIIVAGTAVFKGDMEENIRCLVEACS